MRLLILIVLTFALFLSSCAMTQAEKEENLQLQTNMNNLLEIGKAIGQDIMAVEGQIQLARELIKTGELDLEKGGEILNALYAKLDELKEKALKAKAEYDKVAAYYKDRTDGKSIWWKIGCGLLALGNALAAAGLIKSKLAATAISGALRLVCGAVENGKDITEAKKTVKAARNPIANAMAFEVDPKKG